MNVVSTLDICQQNLHQYTTVRLTTAEVVQHPQVCPIHKKLQYILYFCNHLFHLIEEKVTAEVLNII